MKQVLPGDLNHEENIARMIRVNHAGEYGAARIYAGQLAVLGKSASGDTIRHMAEQEREHLDTFSAMMNRRRVRPSVLMPLWHIGGFALGAATALLGEKAAMACTVAVEDVIGHHYGEQEAELGDDESELKATINKFKAEELEHHDTALEHGAEESPFYDLLVSVIKVNTRLAIWAAKRF